MTDTVMQQGYSPRAMEIRERLEGSGSYTSDKLDDLMNAADAEVYYGSNDLAVDVLRNKYLAPGEQGPLEMWHRVAEAIASVESPERREGAYHEFIRLQADQKFIPGGRVLHGAGRDEARRKPTLSNCYVIPITEDSLEGIYKCLSESAMVYRTGGGVGTDLSILRPRGAPVNATVDTSPGATAFMNLLSESTNAVSQAGRRGALMLTLRVDHPDIYDPSYNEETGEGRPDFIRIKNVRDDKEKRNVQYANISVLITHEFMRAVQDDTDFDLRFEGKVHRTVRAKDLWNKIIENAHASAEPGIIFWDTMREYHNVEYTNPLASTNPCGEQPLAAYTACNLGHLNLVKFVREDGSFDYEGLAEATRVATRFLDDVIDYNSDNHALDKIKESVESDRRVGLGITGLADALVLMDLKYDSNEALDAVESIMEVVRDEAYRTSIELAKERGPFPLFDWEGVKQSKFIQNLPQDIQDEIMEHGMRNSTLLTVAPVGTGSIIAETSSGVEPIFCTSYKRRVKQDDGDTFREYKVYHPLIRDKFGDDEKLPGHVVTAHDIDPFFRVKMQGVIQRYVDSAISSTINLPEDTPVEVVSDIYIAAYKEGLKGVTVYREGSREGILQTEKEEDLENKVGQNGFIHPRDRPAITQGVTERIRTGEGNLFVTINYDPTDEVRGLSPMEVFSTIGMAGGNAAAQSEAISRLMSLALRAGIDPYELVDQLKGISGPDVVYVGDGEKVFSTPDAIGKTLERYLVRNGLHRNGEEVEPIQSEEEIGEEDPLDQKKKSGTGSVTCPECGNSVRTENGKCLTCHHCGWTKC